MIEEINSKGNIKTYKAKLEPIIKEITPRNESEYNSILNNLQNYKNVIYEIIEENNKIYAVLNDNINLENINIIKEGYKEYDNPISKYEINELLSKEKAMCKIISDIIENNSKINGTGLFVKLENNKYGLLTNNHIINNIEIGKTIHFYYLSENKKIEITKDREVYTNKKLDYTFIEIFKEDNIKDYFKIYSNNINNLKNHSIFILQYPNNSNEISFSYGQIKLINNNEIIYNASTTYGSSGSPIILRCNDNLIIGIHHSGYFYKGENIGTSLESILFDIQQKRNKAIVNENKFINMKNKNKYFKKKASYEFKNEINCIYNKKDIEPIDLLYDFKLNSNYLDDEYTILYEETNKNINENNIEIYINNKKINFTYKYENNEIGQINVKFIFNKLLTSTSYLFHKCSSLESIDLSSFNTNKVTNMTHMFSECCSLKSIDTSSFNTNNVTNMGYMFYGCSSLESIDLSSFNTNNVTNMRGMFKGCSSLKSLDLSSFNTNNTTNMSEIFYECSSLKAIDLYIFDTNNVNDMSYMFYGCSSLKSLDLSSFDTNMVTNMSCMFMECSSLKLISLSSFNTNNVSNMSGMFNGCSSLKKGNVKINRDGKKILEAFDHSIKHFKILK